MTEFEWDRSISWSKVTTYDSCPRRFKYKYVDKIEEEEESVARDDGIKFHDFMEKYYSRVGDSPDVEKTVELAKELFDERDQARYRPWIEQWHDFNTWLHKEWGEYWKPVYTEKWIEVVPDGDLPSKYIDVEHWAGTTHHGYIDAIWWDPKKDGYGVIDYKPSAKPNSRLKGQTAYYAEVLLQLEDLLDEGIEWAGSYGYKQGNFNQWDIHWASIKAVRRKVDSLLTLENGYKPNYGHHCDWCDYQEECIIEGEPEGSGGGLLDV